MKNMDRKELEFDELLALLLEGEISRKERDQLIRFAIEDTEKAELIKLALEAYPQQKELLKEIDNTVSGPNREPSFIERIKLFIYHIWYKRWLRAAALAALIVATASPLFYLTLSKERTDVPKHKGIILHNIQIDTTVSNLSPDSAEVQDSSLMDSTKEEKQ